MKKFLLMLFLSISLFTSCREAFNRNVGTSGWAEEDSAFIASVASTVCAMQIEEAKDCPEFVEHPEEAVFYKENLTIEHEIEHEFIQLDDDIVYNVSTVLLKHMDKISLYDIVREYHKCKDAYDNLARGKKDVKPQENELEEYASLKQERKPQSSTTHEENDSNTITIKIKK